MPPGTPLVVVSLCPGRHLYSQYSSRHLCFGVPVCTFSLSVEVVIYIPCVPASRSSFVSRVSRSVISLRTIPVSRSSFIYLPCTPVVPFVVVSLCPGRHLYSLCPGVPVCNFSLRFPVVIYIPCIPVSRSSFVSRSVISSVDKHDVSRQTISWRIQLIPYNDVSRHTWSHSTDTQTTYFYIYRYIAVGGGGLGAASRPQASRARKSLHVILVTCHCSCVPVSHLWIEIDINIYIFWTT